MQELNQYKELPTTIEEDEAFMSLERELGGGISFHDLKVVGEVTYGTTPLPNPPQHAVPPQPTLTDIINNICTQLQLLTTVISSTPQPTAPEATNLQDCVSITLEQADWFKELVEEIIEERIDDLDFDDSVKTAIECEVTDYFNYRFDPKDHFDMGDLVSDAVSDHIGDEVESRIDAAVENYMADAEFKLVKE